MNITHICSLGQWCHTASLIKKHGLKLESYPFDWIFINYKNVLHCIEDNFKTFLDKSHYNSISNTKCGHNVYHPETFNHHNPLTNENDYNYYLRCVDRFNTLLKREEHKLFVLGNFNMNQIDENIKSDMIEINNKLSKLTNNLTLLVIFHLPNKNCNHHEFTYNGNIHFLELHTVSRSHGIFFDNESDNLYFDEVFKNAYKFDVKPLNSSNV
jgi:hypothetical protein